MSKHVARNKESLDMDSLQTLFPQMSKALEEQNIHISNNVGLSNEETLDRDSDERNFDELLATSEQFDVLLNLKKHVEKYGIDKGFLFLCNEDDKLNKLFSISLPTYESLGPNTVITLAHTQELLTAMESEDGGIFKRLWEFIKSLAVEIMNLLKKFFSYFFGTDKVVETTIDDIRKTRKIKTHLNLSAQPLENIVQGSSLNIIREKMSDFSNRVLQAEAELVANLKDTSRVKTDEDRRRVADIFRTSVDVARSRRDNAFVRITNLDVKLGTLSPEDAQKWIMEAEESIATYTAFKNPAEHLASTLRSQIDRIQANLEVIKSKPELMDRMIEERSLLFCDMEALENLTRLVSNVNEVIKTIITQYDVVVNHFFLDEEQMRLMAKNPV